MASLTTSALLRPGLHSLLNKHDDRVVRVRSFSVTVTLIKRRSSGSTVFRCDLVSCRLGDCVAFFIHDSEPVSVIRSWFDSVAFGESL